MDCKEGAVAVEGAGADGREGRDGDCACGGQVGGVEWAAGEEYGEEVFELMGGGQGAGGWGVE